MSCSSSSSPSSQPQQEEGIPASSSATVDETPQTARRVILWDRKTDGGFPETKELKRRVRDVIQPERNLGHVDRDYPSRGKGEGKALADVTKEGSGDKEVGGEVGKLKETGASCKVEGGKCEDCE